jgi:hypothetical protein
LLKEKAALKKKEQNGQLDEEEVIELQGVNKLLTVLQGQEKFCQGEFDKQNKPEGTSKSFGEADADWIAN